MKASCARLAAVLALAHLAVALVPCRPDAAPAHVAHVATAQPCHSAAHSDGAAPPEPSLLLKARCPCGCGSGGAPASGSARLGAALLLAGSAPLAIPDFAGIEGSDGCLPDPGRPPLDHVPLRVA